MVNLYMNKYVIKSNQMLHYKNDILHRKGKLFYNSKYNRKKVTKK